MVDSVKIDTAKSKHVGNYLRCSLDGESAIEQSIVLAKIRRGAIPDPHETLVLRSLIADLESERAKIRAARLAFLKGLSAIKPPNKSDVEAMVSLAETIDAQTAANVTASAILASATAVLDLWSQTVV